MRRIWALLASVQAAMVSLKMDENTAKGTEIARLRESLDKSAIDSNTELEFRIVRQDRQNGLELFEVEGSEGRLLVKQSPDREILCPDPSTKCMLQLQIVVLPQAYYQDLSVSIEVIDQNDNAPRFQQETINIEIFENSHAAFSLDHQMAYDPDTGKNGDIVYSLSSEEYFTLEQYRDDSGDHLDLIPIGNLDHEKTATLSLQLIASNPISDGDLTVQSTRATLAITVLDRNEFKPKFDKESYEFKISESASPGTKIGQVNIFDGDGLDQLELSIREINARQFFRIESNGEIYTNRKLDFESVQRFEFWITASDSMYSERARVTVLIEDENDNEPNVFVAFNQPHENIPRAGWVSENEPAGAHIAYIRAEDADSNGIGDIELLEDQFFELDKGIIKSKKSLDREDHAEYNLHIKACDQGLPKRCTKLRLIVFLRDQNDNAPICTENPTVALVSESAEVGAFITEARVSDADDSNTNGLGFGVLKYELEPAGVKFAIGQETGVITLLEKLDYEEQRSWDMVVVARDGGGLETRCHVNVNVQDVNEAAPIFQTPTEDDLELLISASEIAGTTLMQAEAIDVDYNAESNPAGLPIISYALSGDHQGAIEINSLTGELKLAVDAEQLSNELPTFRIIITATDTGSPRLTTSVRLTVAVREGVKTGLVEIRRALKGGATVALIAILAALTALLFIILVALAFICRHRKLIKSVRYPTMYTHGNSTDGSQRPGTPNSRCDEIENFVKVHEDVSILYDSILTPRSSIGPAQLYKTDFKAKLMQKTHLEKLFKRKYKASARDTASESDHADSGKGESDHDTMNPVGGPKCDETCLRLGHSDSCWIEEDNLSTESKSAFKCSIVHTHNPSLHKSFEKKKDIHSSGYISQDSAECGMYGQIMSTPIKSFKPDQISSSSACTGVKSGLIVANKGDVESGLETGSSIGGSGSTACVIDVRGSNISSSDHLTVRDLASLRRGSNLSEIYRQGTPSPKKVNIV